MDSGSKVSLHRDLIKVLSNDFSPNVIYYAPNRVRRASWGLLQW